MSHPFPVAMRVPGVHACPSFDRFTTCGPCLLAQYECPSAAPIGIMPSWAAQLLHALGSYLEVATKATMGCLAKRLCCHPDLHCPGYALRGAHKSRCTRWLRAAAEHLNVECAGLLELGRHCLCHPGLLACLQHVECEQHWLWPLSVQMHTNHRTDAAGLKVHCFWRAGGAVCGSSLGVLMAVSQVSSCNTAGGHHLELSDSASTQTGVSAVGRAAAGDVCRDPVPKI